MKKKKIFLFKPMFFLRFPCFAKFFFEKNESSLKAAYSFIEFFLSSLYCNEEIS